MNWEIENIEALRSTLIEEIDTAQERISEELKSITLDRKIEAQFAGQDLSLMNNGMNGVKSFAKDSLQMMGNVLNRIKGVVESDDFLDLSTEHYDNLTKVGVAQSSSHDVTRTADQNNINDNGTNQYNPKWKSEYFERVLMALNSKEISTQTNNTTVNQIEDLFKFITNRALEPYQMSDPEILVGIITILNLNIGEYYDFEKLGRTFEEFVFLQHSIEQFISEIIKSDLLINISYMVTTQVLISSMTHFQDLNFPYSQDES